MAVWVELVISLIFCFLMVALCFYITRMVTIPVLRETIAMVKKRRQSKQQKAHPGH
jgi:uncharacterized protein (DUF2062 family)